MAYSAGNLELQLTAISSQAVSSLDTVINKLSSLSSVLKSVTTTDMKWINSFGTKMKNLSKKMTDLDWSGIDAGFNRLTVSITPFIDKVATAENSLRALNETLTKVSGKKLTNLSNSARKGGFGGFNFKKLFNVGVALRFGRAVERIVQYGVDFTETLNLWQVSMRENLDQADEFIKKMNRAYGISQTTLMNAQATFKNMIGSLGNISDTVAYQLSESILQMATDFSSLYNVTFENAITKFQAALAGQVRPIRSGSGYDITENTLFQLYQELGGTKTQRQLNRTEKQLLAIYAVFQQMQRSGAVGDLSKTLDNFANQSRIMTENFKELATYTGLFFQDLLQSWGVLKYINAGIIFLTEIMKALTNYKAPNFLDDMFESVTDTNDEVDKLQGKLLDFDKFRALDSSTGLGGSLAIDEKLVNALSDYQSILNDVDNEARKLAESWLLAIGFTKDENGEFTITKDRLDEIKSTVEGITLAIGAIVAYNLGSTLVSLVNKIGLLTKSMSLLNSILVGSLVFTIVKLVDAVRNGDEQAQALYGTITGLLIGAIIALNWELIKTKAIQIGAFFRKIGNVLSTILTPSLAKATTGAKLLNTTISKTNIVFGAMAGVLSFIIFDGLLSSMGEDARKVVAPILAVVGAVAALTAAFMAMQGVMTWGTALPILLASVGAAVAGVKAMLSPEQFAVGASDIDGGTLFVAGEAGRTEAVYTGANGKANVANVSQMEEAFYNALIRYGRENRGTNTPITVNIDGKPVFNSVRGVANSMGLDFARKSY